MYLTVKQQIKHLSKADYKSIRKLSHIAKNLANPAIYNIRQYCFKEEKYLSYKDNYNLLKSSPNYKLLNSNMAQQILKEVDGSFKSFFGLLKLAKQGKYDYKNIKLPNYLPKNGFTTLVIGFIRLSKNKLILPYSNQFNKLFLWINKSKKFVLYLNQMLGSLKSSIFTISSKNKENLIKIKH